MKKALSKKNLWEGLPGPLRKSLGSVAGLVPLPWLLGKTFRRWDRLVEEAETWSPEEIERFQVAKLRDVCELAYAKSPYYRKSFDTVGFRPGELKRCEDLQALPFIDKHTINENRDELLTVDPSDPGLDYVATGGSGGEPMRFLIGSDRSGIEYAHLTRAWRRVGYNHTTPKAVLRGQILNAGRSGLHTNHDPLLRNYSFSNFHLNDVTMHAYLAKIASIGPCYLHTYPSSLAMLVRYLKRTGEQPPRNIQGLLLESENVYEEDRAAAEELFQVRYFSSYGHSEKLVMAAECEHSTKYHVFPTYGYCELIDEAGDPVTTPGEEGEIVGTGFINRAMPFIRYRTGDYATYASEACTDCGRNHLVIEKIRGHNTMECLVARDGSLIPYSAVNVHDDTFEGVLQFQFVQHEPGLAVIRLILAEGGEAFSEERVVGNMNQRFQGRLQVTAELVKEIPLTPRGKSIFVKQHVSL